MTDTFLDDVRDAISHSIHELTPEELTAAVETFLDYVGLIDDVYAALETEPDRLAKALRLTAVHRAGTVEVGRVEPSGKLI
jgi:hypothetical protein